MDSMEAMDYKDVAYQHNNTRWTRRDGYRSLAKVRVAGSNPVVRSEKVLVRPLSVVPALTRPRSGEPARSRRACAA